MRSVAAIMMLSPIAVGLVYGANALRTPSAMEALGVGLRADDVRAALAATSKMASDRATAILLIARADIAAGHPKKAIALLQPLTTGRTRNATAEAYLDEALAANGDARRQLAHAYRQAELSGDPNAFRRVAKLAAAAGADPVERIALTHLDAGHDATASEAERLASLEEREGNVAQARNRLDQHFNAHQQLSTVGLQHLLQLSLATGDAHALSSLHAALAARGAPPSLQTITADLLAMGRPVVAAQMAAQASPDERRSLWPLRILALQKAGAIDQAQALLAKAAAQPGTASPADIVRAAFDLDQPLLLVTAAEKRTIEPLTSTMALDLVRRAALKNRFDLIPRIERLSSVDWRRSDPWLAIRVAEATHDIPGALRSAGFLPAAIVVEAREAIAARSGDKALLRSLLLAHATADPAACRAIAERLLAIGADDDAVALLEADALAHGGPHGEALDRLLYLWGPRPPQPALDWLRSRIGEATSEADQLAWLTLYVRRDRPTRALRMLEASPLGDRTDMLIERLTLAGHLSDTTAANRALARLLDGRQLSPASLTQISAQLSRSAGRSQRLALAQRRLDAGVAVANDRMDLAWDARERGDFPAASAFAQQQLRTKPRDVDALRLLADISRGPDEKVWTQRALAALPDAPANFRTRAELLGRLGQTTDALVAVEQARRMKPDDKSLVALQARLLIQAGKPGRAQALFEQ
jgi:hypothetical protein